MDGELAAATAVADLPNTSVGVAGDDTPTSSPSKEKKAKRKARKKEEASSDRVARRPRHRSQAFTRGADVLPLASYTREGVLKAALSASASGRPFEDVSFFAFSRRRLDGLVDKPLPLLANSSLIRKASSHFDYLFARGFAESGVTDMAAPYPATRPDSTPDYAYLADSDLEDEEDAEDGLANGDWDDEDIKSTSDVKDHHKSASPATSKKLNGSALPEKPGKVVFLDDIAYKTWKAFMFYAYLGENELSFAPLRSEQKLLPSEGRPDQAPPCSPKSMYRLAEKYDIVPLQELALAEIKKRLTTHNILEEIFSTFTSLYTDIRTMQIEYLVRNMNDSGIKSRLPTWMEALEGGHLPKGAGQIISMLLSSAHFGPVPALMAPPDSGMKRCPGGCTSTLYTCGSCSRRF